MVYNAPFYRMVAIGNLYGDNFNFGLSFTPSDASIIAVTPTFLTAIAGIIGTWFPKQAATTDPSFTTAAVLTSLKLNRIGTDGKYMDDDAMEHVYPTPIPGTSATKPAPQLTLVHSFEGSAPRGLAGRGRVYLPPMSIFGSLGADGRLTTAQAQDKATGFAALISSLNAAIDAADVSAGNVKVGIMSNVGAGRSQWVEKVRVGRTIDTMRSRRNKLAEEYSVANVT